MASYSDEFKRAAIQRVHSGETQKSVAADLSLSPATLGKWVRESGDMPKTGNIDNGIDPENKLEHVIAIKAMNDREIEEYADENGVSVHSLNEWHSAVIGALSDQQADYADPIDTMNRAVQQIQRENKHLQARIDRIRNI